MSDLCIHLVTYIRASADRVWNALTDPDMTERYWMGTRMESDWRVGSQLRYVIDGKVTDDHTIIAIDRPRSLVHTFRPVFGVFADEAASRVAYTLEEHSGVVRLTMLHDGFAPKSRVHPACSRGWPMILSGLKTLLETGEPL